MLKKVATLGLKLFFDKGNYIFYTHDRQAFPEFDFSPNLKIYKTYEEGKLHVNAIFKNPKIEPLYYRFKSGTAQLITWEDHGKILAHGWIQSWEPFYRKFGRIFEKATMLGPYYSEPKERGKGLYKKLLFFSLQHSPVEKPIAIFTSPENISSQRGIEGCGFHKIGTYRIVLLFRLFPISIKLI